MSKEKFHLESTSNGLGAQSMLLFLMACRREIPATVSITANTGWEADRTWSNGRRGPISEYFNEIVVPMAEKHGLKAVYVRSVDVHKNPLPDLIDSVRKAAAAGTFKGLHIPMFGSKGGRLRQSCTDKWKIRAINQYARSVGATTSCSAQGIHMGEASRRVKGRFLRMEGKWSIYQNTVMVKSVLPDGTKTKVEKDVKWLTHYYPLVDLGLNRNDCQRLIVAEKIPYLLSSECDGCPHKDLTRWERTDPKVLADLANIEAQFNGEFFFTDKRIPLLESIEAMKAERAKNPERYKVEADFGCQNSICGV